MTSVVEVVAGLAVRDDGHMLMALRRPDRKRPSMWENPGGKVESGESPRYALAREWHEELGVDASPAERLTEIQIDAEVYLSITLYHVKIWPGQEPRPLDSQEVRWVDPLHAIQWLPCAPATYLFYPAIRRFMEQR